MMTSSLSAQDTKKTLQIALVGVRPADQVMLKGYMRVILRLDIDLEWVSANHASVDFYMVNLEFAQAQSVKKLIDSQPNVAVLYVQRDEVTGGGLSNDVLTFPLKELDQLKNWLYSHIESLKPTTNTSPAIPADIPTPQPTPAMQPASNPPNKSRMTLDEIIASRNNNNNNNNNNTLNTAVTQASTPAFGQSPQANNSIAAENLITVFRQLQLADNHIVSLVQDNNLIAYVHPKRQRVWVINPITSFTTDLKIVPNINQPSLDTQPSEDLVQWLWEKSFDMPMPIITQLAKDDIVYHLTSWVKPHSSQDSHDILKIQCFLEARQGKLSDILQLTQGSRDLTLRTIAGLVASGVMQPSVYIQLKNVPSIDTVLDTVPLATSAQPLSSSPSTPSVSSTPQPSNKPDEGMKGFLSKLRRKLGL